MSLQEIYFDEPQRRAPESVLSAQYAIKTGVRSLLGKLSAEVDANADTGSNNLAIYMSSLDETSGLETGLLVVTDRSIGPDDNAAFEQDRGGFTYSYCANSLDCVWVEELSVDNVNIQELDWSLRKGPIRPRLTETGLANVSVRDVIGGHRDWIARIHQASKFGVSPEDLLLFDGFADAARINRFFGQILMPGMVEKLQPIAV